MPRAKCRLAIETMPGMMMISENAKNRLRRPMMFSRRIRGAGATTAVSWAFPSSIISATCSCGVTSDTSDTIHPKKACTPEAAAGEHDREQVVGDDDRRDQARHDSDRERLGESL